MLLEFFFSGIKSSSLEPFCALLALNAALPTPVLPENGIFEAALKIVIPTKTSSSRLLSAPTTTNSLRGKLCVGGYPPFQKPFVLILQAPKQQSCDNLHPHSRTVTPTPVALQRPQQYLGTLLLLASKWQTPNNLADHAMDEGAFITQCTYSVNSTAITYTQSVPTHVKLRYNANSNTICIANFIRDSQQLRTVTTRNNRNGK